MDLWASLQWGNFSGELLKGCHVRPFECSYVVWLGIPCKVNHRFESLSSSVYEHCCIMRGIRSIINGTMIWKMMILYILLILVLMLMIILIVIFFNLVQDRAANLVK